MNYRIAETKDIPSMVEIRKKQLIDEGMKPETMIDDELTEFFQKHLSNSSLVEWLAEENDSIIATAGIMFFEFPPSFNNRTGIRGYITNMYTDPAYRGRSIATEMLSKLVKEARARGVSRIFLGASDMGKPVYKKFGFTETDKWMELEV